MKSVGFMKNTPTTIDFSEIPQELHKFITNAKLFDSSCSPNARVTFIDKDNGYFLKTATKDNLKKEAEMTKYFHKKGLSTAVIAYISSDKDFLLTEKIQGEDCTAAKYLEQPERLCDTIAERLAILHTIDFSDCPIKNHTDTYI
jgi:kanamycin kinase